MAVVYRVTVYGKLGGQDIKNVVHFMKEVPAQTDKAVLADHVIQRLLGQWRFLQARVFQWLQVMVQNPNDPNDLPHIVPAVMSGLGQESVMIFLPMTYVLKLKTAVAGRTGRGRMCIAGVPCNGLETGFWSQFMVGQGNSIAQSHMQWFGPTNPQSGFHLVVAPRNPEGVEFKVVTSIVPRNYPGTQVRRNYFRGK